MQDLILLLTGDEEAPFLGQTLARANGSATIRHTPDIVSVEVALAVPAYRRRLIAFSTGVIVPGHLLDRFDAGAFNFHPGTPDYPGNQVATFAAYDGAPVFGATCHRMIARVDAGEIVAVERRMMTPAATRTDYAVDAYQAMIELFIRLAPELADLGRAPAPSGDLWSGAVRRNADVDAMRWITPDIDAEEFSRRLRAFEDGEPGSLRINLHGWRFRIVPEEN
jgi:methionyl-tRNA formyltransferase